jgi:3-isopropylmalate dehydrogenase
MGSFDILVLAGDGIGPEVTAEGVRVLEAVGRRFGHAFSLREDLVGGCCIDAHGVGVRPETLQAASVSHAVLFGAVGGPKWDDPAAKVRPEDGLLALRSELRLWANLRPVAANPALLDASPLRREIIDGVDILVIRELTSGLYFGKPKERRVVEGRREAVDTLYYAEEEVRRVAELGFRLARARRRKLTSVDKANVLAASRLWREIVNELRPSYPDVAVEHVLVDAMTMHLIRRPADFDVIIADNMFGDILTDEASMLTGSMGLLPSASLGGDVTSGGMRLGLFEPIHGSAPDIAGRGVANPLAMILCVGLLLRYSCALEKEALAVEAAVADVLSSGLRTADIALGGASVGTRAMADAVLERLSGR